MLQNAHLIRAKALMEQGRVALARDEVLKALAEDPGGAIPNAMLASCLSSLGEGESALEHAKRAIHADPDQPYCHFVLAEVNMDLGRFPDAEAAIREAIRMMPDEAHGFSILARILAAMERWPETLEASDEGLKRDPADDSCMNTRSVALTHLGRRKEASVTLEGALQQNPDNPSTHANQGWLSLHSGEHRKALEHFREALRLDPELDWARSGLVEALKARHFIYRIMLSYFLWMSRLSSRTQWMVIIIGFLAYRSLAVASKYNPEITPYSRAFMLVYLAFVLMTWLANPIFEALLRLNRFGRYALSAEQFASANALLGLFTAGVVSMVIGFSLDYDVFKLLGLVTLGLIIPSCTFLRLEAGKPKIVLGALTAGLALAGLYGATATTLSLPNGGPVLGAFIVSLVIFPWIANIAVMRQTS